jgi:hypothetical protein
MKVEGICVHARIGVHLLHHPFKAFITKPEILAKALLKSLEDANDSKNRNRKLELQELGHFNGESLANTSERGTSCQSSDGCSCLRDVSAPCHTYKTLLITDNFRPVLAINDRLWSREQRYSGLEVPTSGRKHARYGDGKLKSNTVPSGRTKSSPVARGCCAVAVSPSPACPVVCATGPLDPAVVELNTCRYSENIGKNMSIY